jgi:hypothetical protein
MEKAVLNLDGWAGRREIPCLIVKETPKRFLIRLEEDCGLPGRYRKKADEVYVPKYAVSREELKQNVGSEGLAKNRDGKGEAQNSPKFPMSDRDKNKVHSADIEPRGGYHYLLINGAEAGRFDSMQKALAAREVFLQAELEQMVQDCVSRSGPYMNPID